MDEWLPFDVWLSVFELLAAPDLARVAATCKLFAALSYHDGPWRAALRRDFQLAVAVEPPVVNPAFADDDTATPVLFPPVAPGAVRSAYMAWARCVPRRVPAAHAEVFARTAATWRVIDNHASLHRYGHGGASAPLPKPPSQQAFDDALARYSPQLLAFFLTAHDGLCLDWEEVRRGGGVARLFLCSSKGRRRSKTPFASRCSAA